MYRKLISSAKQKKILKTTLCCEMSDKFQFFSDNIEMTFDICKFPLAFLICRFICSLPLQSRILKFFPVKCEHCLITQSIRQITMVDMNFFSFLKYKFFSESIHLRNGKV